MSKKYLGKNIRYVNGYPAIYIDESHSTVYIHILEMEKKLGRKLKDSEVVHHCDKNRKNYNINNLWCFKTVADHTAYHHGRYAIQDEEGIYYCPDKGIKIDEKYIKNNKCLDCGKLIYSGATRCRKCFEKYRNLHLPNSNKLKPNRDELKEKIKTMSFLKIGKLYNVSDNAIRKWCKKYNLPYKYNDIKNITDDEWEKI